MAVPSRRGPGSVARPHDDRTEPTPPEPTHFGPVHVEPAELPAITAGQLEVTTSVSGTIATAHVHGELLQETVARFVEVVSDLAGDVEVAELVVDLSGTSYLDSTGLGSLVNLRNRVLERGGRFVVVRPGDRVFRLFEITQLDSVFDFADD